MNERDMREKEKNLAARLSSQLKKIKVVDAIVKTRTWFDESYEGKVYPVVPSVILKLEGGKTLIITAEGKVNQNDEVKTRLQLDFKAKPFNVFSQPEMKKNCGSACEVKAVKIVDCAKLPKNVRVKYNLPASGIAKQVYFCQKPTVQIKYEYAGKNAAEAASKLLAKAKANPGLVKR